MTQLTTEQVLVAADRLVAAFAATDTQAYFACFAPDATFAFHTEPALLADRAAYEREWAGWLAEGWRVKSCTSTDRRVQLVGDVAVLTHEVETTTSSPGGSTTTRERESIVFALDGDSVVAVHEHLSPVPAGR
jgi:ketosteroid isomerase-like protein